MKGMDKFLCVLGIYDQETQRVLKEHQEDRKSVV